MITEIYKNNISYINLNIIPFISVTGDVENDINEKEKPWISSKLFFCIRLPHCFIF
jgi:hypothetical protein